jgi:CheY-like chemotaxis protein
VGGVFSKGELAGIAALVVEDQDDLRDCLIDFLGFCGMDIRAAASGNEAFCLFQAGPPDIIVSDIGMPDGTGLDLLKRIRSLTPEAGGLTPAIAVSGESASEDSFEAGFHVHFQKPVEPLVLIDTIRDFVRAERVGRAQWSVTTEGESNVLLRFDGHVTAADVGAAIPRLVEVIARSNDGLRVIADVRRVSGFDPSGGLVAQRIVWQVRDKIRGVVIVGASRLAHLVARSSCLILGLPCEFVDERPG